MLQVMQKKVTEEGETEQQLFNQYMCYCSSSQKTLAQSINEAETKIPQLESEIKAGNAEKSQLTSDITQAKADRDAADKSIQEATSLRNKEAAAFAKEDTENKANVAAMAGALTSLRKGTGAAFLQTASASTLRQLAVDSDLPEWDRHALTSFLSSDQTEDSDEDASAPSSDEIIGIISQMHETIGKEIVEAAGVEKASIESFNSLVSAKSKEVTALKIDIQTKTARLGEVGVQLVNLAQDLADTTKQLENDRKFLADLKRGCDSKNAEWGERSKTRQDELVALGETIQILNDDAASHLFKKTMATPSFIQIQESSKEVLDDAREALKSGQDQRDPRLNLLSMAMRGKKVNFDKVVAMVDKMALLLAKEQTDDDNKKAYCTSELDQAEDDKKNFAETISDHEKNIANAKDMYSTLADDIAQIAAGIKALNKAVAEATKQRRAQNTAYQEELAANNAAISILNMAKDRLKKFYEPKTRSAALISASRQHATRHKAAKSAVQEAFSFVQTSSDVKPADAPDTWGDKSAKSDSSGILGMLDTLIKNAQKQVVEMQVEEKDAQFEYEQFMKDSSEKHAADAKAISVKESAKAEVEAGVQKRGKALKVSSQEAVSNGEYLESLHKECDWLLKHYSVRQQARTAEIASLKQAKAVLTGADFDDSTDSFLQLHQEVRGNLRRVSRK